MKIEYFGHSCFRLTTKNGTSILTDPFTQIGYELPVGLKADIVLCSHRHFDHAFVDGVQTKKVIFGYGVWSEKDVKIQGLQSYHDEVEGQKRGENTVFFIEADGVKICHLGDYGEDGIERLKEQLYGVDLLLLPVGGTYTVDAKGAEKIVKTIVPKHVLPMHYKTQGLSIEIADEKEFLSFYNENEIERVGEEFVYNGENKRIILMERRAR